MEGAYNIVFGLIDKGLLEFVGPTGAARQTIRVGRLLAAVQTGRVYDYAGFMLGALTCAFLFINFFKYSDPLFLILCGPFFGCYADCFCFMR